MGIANVSRTVGRGRPPAGVLAVAAVSVLSSLFCAAPALAESPVWHLASSSRPSVLPSGGEGTVVVTASGVSAVEVDGSSDTVRLTDELPAGVEVVENAEGEPEISSVAGLLGILGKAVCSSSPVAGADVVSCTYEGRLAPYEALEVRIRVRLDVSAVSGAVNRAHVSGGGAAGVSVSRALAIGSASTPFGVEQYELTPENADGSPAMQAGAHPFQLTSTLFLNSGEEIEFPPGGQEQQNKVVPPAMVKDLSFKLPPGLIGNPTAFPQCTATQFSPTGPLENNCPADTQIGVAQVTVYEPIAFGLFTVVAPLYNLVPAHGEPARFGFIALVFPITIGTSIRTGGDYGVTATVRNTTELPVFLASQVSFWGDPGDPRHDNARGSCAGISRLLFGCTPSKGGVNTPLLTMPTSCGDPLTEPLESSVTVDPWSNPAAVTAPLTYRWHDSSGVPLALDGCNKLGFEPSLTVAPDGREASTPTGLTVDQHLPQEEILTPKGLAQSDVKSIKVTFPEGVTLNPAGADGLEACSEGQIGFTSVEHPSGRDLFTPTLSSPFCPDASKIGTVRIKTPLLPNQLEGAVYLAAQNANPFGSLVAVYIVAEDPVSGVVVKVPGEVTLDPVTGRVSSTFLNLPQTPFENAEFHFFGGERAPLSTPARCGTYTTEALFTPSSGGTPVNTTSAFEITSGPNHTPCPGASLPFSPSLTAGTTSIQAGGFSPFTTTITRQDGQQSIQSFQLHMPSGLSGLLTGVELCGEAQADAGTCGPNSLIGETTVSVGLGGDPFSVTGGKVYITGPYEGAPFGISVAVPAKAGPYDLGTVVVRGTIQVDPTTSALTVTTNTPAQGYAIPHILDGIPLEIKHVNFVTTRSGFTFNPTNCDPMGVTGSISSVEGSSSAVSVPFQVTNCAVLGFKPQFSVSTSGKTSRAMGASLHVRLTYPKAAFGSQANIAKVKVDLPKQLPSRLTTLQKACPDSVFNQNPAACSSASRIGTAKATTPLVPVALEGPVYFVSHGGAKFPELIIVLSGYGVTVDLHSETFINKAGITSSTFRTIPDVPVGTFELTLPQGADSALAANGNLCSTTRMILVKRRVTVNVNGHNKKVTRRVRKTVGASLLMPTAFTAQNGMVTHQNTPIEVTGCARHKAKKIKSGRGARRHRKVRKKG